MSWNGEFTIELDEILDVMPSRDTECIQCRLDTNDDIVYILIADILSKIFNYATICM